MPDSTQVAALVRRQYERPPVVEAVAQLDFSEPLEWKVTTPGSVFERLRDEYPAEPEVQHAVQANLGPRSEPGAPAGSDFAIRTGPQRVVYKSEGHDRLVMVSPDNLSVHGLPPYEGWEALLGRLQHTASRLDGVVPGTFGQASVRYINRIELPSEQVKFSDWLTVDIRVPAPFPDNMTSFIQRAEFVEDDGTHLKFTWGSVDSPEGKAAFVIDFDLSRPLVPGVDAASAFAVLEELKRRETVLFESVLEDRTRELFGVE